MISVNIELYITKLWPHNDVEEWLSSQYVSGHITLNVCQFNPLCLRPHILRMSAFLEHCVYGHLYFGCLTFSNIASMITYSLNVCLSRHCVYGHLYFESLPFSQLRLRPPIHWMSAFLVIASKATYTLNVCLSRHCVYGHLYFECLSFSPLRLRLPILWMSAFLAIATTATYTLNVNMEALMDLWLAIYQ